MTALTLNLASLIDRVSDLELELLSRDNPDARLETNSQGQLIIMPPTGGDTGRRNSELNFQIQLWNKQNKLGKVFDSSTGFKLKNGAVRSPDVSWVSFAKWQALSAEQRRKYLPLAPDFILELMSSTDSLDELRSKMREYRESGVRLGWLINPDDQQVEIYREEMYLPGEESEILDNPSTLSGENILPNLIVDLSEILS